MWIDVLYIPYRSGFFFWILFVMPFFIIIYICVPFFLDSRGEGEGDGGQVGRV